MIWWLIEQGMSRIKVLLLLAYFSSCYNTKFAHQQHNSDSTKPNTIWYWNVAACWWQIRFIPHTNAHTYLTYLILLNVRSRNSLSNIEICKFKHRNPVVFSSRRQPVIRAIFTRLKISQEIRTFYREGIECGKTSRNHVLN